LSAKEPIVSFSEFDPDRIVVGIEEIQRLIPHREQMLLLDGILFLDSQTWRAVGFHDVRADEFWVRGHFPHRPLMPGVIICECAAQLSAYMASHNHSVDGIMGLGGLQDIRFRAPVVPGQRLILMLQQMKFRRNVISFYRFQAYVDRQLVADGELIGSAIPPPQTEGSAGTSNDG
jgi:3-hydroxyacyl-[acyl-carrier-protein] dehydratase